LSRRHSTTFAGARDEKGDQGVFAYREAGRRIADPYRNLIASFPIIITEIAKADTR
jgi:hypothetical protein